MSFTAPGNGASDVARNQQIAVIFAEQMDPATVTTATLTVTGPGATPVAGTVTYTGLTAVFDPTSDLAAGTSFTATVSVDAKDLAGTPLTDDYSWSFRTGTGLDTTPPEVISTSPVATSNNVALGQLITATFAEPMDPATITTASFTVTGPGGDAMAGSVTYVGRTATFRVAGGLAGNTHYTARILPGVQDLAGNSLLATHAPEWEFVTGDGPDATPPLVTFTDPIAGETGVAPNKQIAINFSEWMDPATMSTTTLKVTGPGTEPVAGTVTHVGVTAIFHPYSGDLAANTRHTVTVRTTARDLAGNALAQDYTWSFTTGDAPDVTPPVVTFTDPVNGATGVAPNKQIIATFSEAMDPLTISTYSLQLSGPGTTLVFGSLVNIGPVVIFRPNSGVLQANTRYTVNVNTSAKDLAGNALAQDYTWSFTTGTSPDTTPPVITFTDPVAGADGVATNKQVIATFSEAMDPLTVMTYTVRLSGPGTTPVIGAVTNVGPVFTFHPVADALAANTRYTATVRTSARDLAGNALAQDYTWGFTTGNAPDVTPPTVAFTAPQRDATGVATNTQIVAVFNESMNPLTVMAYGAQLSGPGSTPVLGTVTNAGPVFTFRPIDGELEANTLYTMTIKTASQDLAGNALAQDYVWSFTTGDAPDETAPTVTFTSPADGSSLVATGQQVAVTFSEAMDPATVTAAVMTVTGPGDEAVAGTVSHLGTVFTFRPTSGFLDGSTTYTATIATGAADLAGNALASSYVWTFTTGPSVMTAVTESLDGNLPEEFVLWANYPNPFNPSTTILYQLPETAAVRLEVFDVLGQKVRTLVSQQQAAGSYQVVWDSRDDTGSPVATGTYVYRLQAGGSVQARQLLLLR